MEHLINFKLNPTQFFIAKILIKYNLNLDLLQNIYKYLSKENLMHMTIFIYNNEFYICYRFNIINVTSNCILCEPKRYYTCYICNIDHFDETCMECNLCNNCYPEIEHNLCENCNLFVCNEYHKICNLCDRCHMDEHRYCELCDGCVNNYHRYCEHCRECYESNSHTYCRYCNFCFSSFHKYCEYCDRCSGWGIIHCFVCRLCRPAGHQCNI